MCESQSTNIMPFLFQRNFNSIKHSFPCQLETWPDGCALRAGAISSCWKSGISLNSADSSVVDAVRVWFWEAALPTPGPWEPWGAIYLNFHCPCPTAWLWRLDLNWECVLVPQAISVSHGTQEGHGPGQTKKSTEHLTCLYIKEPLLGNWWTLKWPGQPRMLVETFQPSIRPKSQFLFMKRGS